MLPVVQGIYEQILFQCWTGSRNQLYSDSSIGSERGCRLTPQCCRGSPSVEPCASPAHWYGSQTWSDPGRERGGREKWTAKWALVHRHCRFLRFLLWFFVPYVQIRNFCFRKCNKQQKLNKKNKNVNDPAQKYFHLTLHHKSGKFLP